MTPDASTVPDFARRVLVPPTEIVADLRASGVDATDVIAFTGSNTLAGGTFGGEDAVFKVAWGYRDVIDGLPPSLRPAAYGFTFYQRDNAAARARNEAAFRREADLTAALSGHPGTPTLLCPPARTEAGRLYFATARCPQGSVAAAVADGWLLPPEAIGPWLRQGLSAVGRAHAHGSVHGELGPDNLLTDNDLPVVADFGSARPLVPVAQHRPPPRSAWIRGELHWPPEYAADHRDPRPTVDLYGLGSTTIFAVTGRYPRYGADLAGMLPARWAPVLISLVAHDPANRPPTADAALRLTDD
ncbi:hypothetical protein MMF93_00075 [Streptomyces tubbatahanensis]|uniref:Protein kinase domain-containing protein n=1 Tax=Streptomyces tubbatahanensis TaxID=2923272 RepID=A0ABY3XKT5_9ACTN|nr:phosphotransferase [Streptomyces tubbatahanensis]UNS95037.1 hypothetical protein MMF93_00075 [Streptomyces tubbatahanensis]